MFKVLLIQAANRQQANQLQLQVNAALHFRCTSLASNAKIWHIFQRHSPEPELNPILSATPGRISGLPPLGACHVDARWSPCVHACVAASC
jgi:hypothetical protein